MHSLRTADFLIEMAKHSRTREMFSYLAGFLCHYALDSTAHPYIISTAQSAMWERERIPTQGYMHLAIEQRLDRQELKRLGLDLRDRPITKGFMVPFLPESMRSEYEAVVKSIYGWDDSWTKFRASYRYYKIYFSIAEDPWGIVDMVLKHMPRGAFGGKAAALSYRSKICDGMTFEEFEPLRRESVRRAVELIEAAYKFRYGEIGERELREIIGVKDYSGVSYIL